MLKLGIIAMVNMLATFATVSFDRDRTLTFVGFVHNGDFHQVQLIKLEVPFFDDLSILKPERFAQFTKLVNRVLTSECDNATVSVDSIIESQVGHGDFFFEVLHPDVVILN